MPSYNNTPPADSGARTRALNPEQSFAVTAPAGSGKTGLLTQRLLTLLQTVETPEEIVAITFTKKAANEMRERILHALQTCKEQTRPTDSYAQKNWDLAQQVLQRDTEKNWQLLKNPRRLRIQTIDSLCRSIVSQLPFDSQLGATPNTLDNPDYAYEEAAKSFLKLIEGDSDYSADLEQLFRHTDNNQMALEKLFVSLLKKREQWLPLIHSARHQQAQEYLEQTLHAVINEHLLLVRTALQPYGSDLCLLLDKAATYIEDIIPDAPLSRLKSIVALPTPDLEAFDEWKIITDFLLTNKSEYRLKPTKNQGFPAGKAHAAHKAAFSELTALFKNGTPELESLLGSVRILPPPEYGQGEWNILNSLTRLLPRLVAELNLTFKALGSTDFIEITLAAIFALGDEDAPSDLALKLDYRIKHILVDEFQDTALPQLNLLKKLTAGWQPNDGKTLFIVGDGMQSCYGFRNAKVGLFLNAKLHGIGFVKLQSEELSVNFRSEAGIVEWINTVFDPAFPATDNISHGAVSYSPSIAFKPEGLSHAVSLSISPYSSTHKETDKQNIQDATKEQAEEREALEVVDLICRAQKNNPTNSIAVLVRGRSHLRKIIPALQAQGLTFQATDIDALNSRMVIADLLSLTRALLRFDDRIAWLSILRAPWCGLDLHDLYHLATTDLGADSPPADRSGYPIIWQQLCHREKIQTLSDAGEKNLDRFMQVLQPAIATRQRKPLRLWVFGIWQALGGPACLIEAADHENATQFFDTLEHFELGSQIDDWENFTQAIEKLYAAPMQNTESNLHIMTLHKSKGLEFDTVIIPGLNRRTSNDSKELLLWHERLSTEAEVELLLAPIAETGKDHNPIYEYVRHEKKLQAEYEATRLLYVGCTRAIKQLHLLACLPHTEEKPCQTQKAGGLLGSIWTQVAPQAEILKTQAASPEAEQKPVQDWILRLPSNWQRPTPVDNTQLAHLRGGTDSAESFAATENAENTPTRETPQAQAARCTGTVIHQILQHLAGQIPAEEAQQWALTQSSLWQNLLQGQGISGDLLTHALRRTSHAIVATLSDPRGRWLLDNNHEQAHSELSLIQATQGHGFREHIIDRTFIDAGVRWIIDYKTSEPAEGESTQAFIKSQCQAYKEQLERYKQLFANAEHPVKIALYFPLLNLKERLIEVD